MKPEKILRTFCKSNKPIAPQPSSSIFQSLKRGFYDRQISEEQVIASGLRNKADSEAPTGSTIYATPLIVLPTVAGTAASTTVFLF